MSEWFDYLPRSARAICTFYFARRLHTAYPNTMHVCIKTHGWGTVGPQVAVR